MFRGFSIVVIGYGMCLMLGCGRGLDVDSPPQAVGGVFQESSGVITVIAPIKLAEGKTEEDLLAASEVFQRDVVSHQPGVLRRELVRKSDGTYLDIVQFRSMKDAEKMMELGKESTGCREFFAVMDMDSADASLGEMVHQSLATYE